MNGTSMWVAVGRDAGDDAKTLLHSTNGISWQPSRNGVCFATNGYGVAYRQLLYGMSPGNYPPIPKTRSLPLFQRPCSC